VARVARVRAAGAAVSGGLVIGGRIVPVPGRLVRNWHDDSRLRLAMGEDGRARRGHAIRQVILHTTRGIPGGKDRRAQVVYPGRGPGTWGRLNIAKMWRDDAEYSGAHLVVDHDETIFCLADLELETAFHATACNDTSVGIEIKQGGDAELYEGQLAAVVDLVNVITLELGIQRQIPHLYRGRPLKRLDEKGGRGADVVGVFGHRDQTARRGAGDPGDPVMERLAAAGYEPHDFERGGDLEAWRRRQSDLGVAADGVPGPDTVAALRARGFGGGLWRCPPAGVAELAANPS
jgi:hypothetical protein